MPAGTVSTPSAASTKPAGAPTRLTSTVPAAGGETLLSESLPSTLVAALPPGAMVKLSSTAIRLPLLMLSVTVAVPHSAASGAGRQAW